MTTETTPAQAAVDASVAATNSAIALSLDAILAADDLGRETLEVPEWGGTVTVRGLSFAEWSAIRSEATVGESIDEQLITAGLLSKGLVSPAVTADQAKLLMGKSTASLNLVAGAVIKLSNLGEDAVAEAQATFQG